MLDEPLSVHIVSILMNRHLYPTPAQIAIVCVWANEGVAGLIRLMEERKLTAGTRPDRARTEVMDSLKDLIARLGLPYEYERLRQRVYQQPLTRLNPGLLHQFTATLRMGGYIHRDTEGTQWVPTPLTGRQIHTLRLLACGMTRPDTARVLGVTVPSLGEYLTKLRDDMGCDTLEQALMAAHDRSWLPSHRERARMRTAQAHHRPKGYPHAYAKAAR